MANRVSALMFQTLGELVSSRCSQGLGAALHNKQQTHRHKRLPSGSQVCLHSLAEQHRRKKDMSTGRFPPRRDAAGASNFMLNEADLQSEVG